MSFPCLNLSPEYNSVVENIPSTLRFLSGRFLQERRKEIQMASLTSCRQSLLSPLPCTFLVRGEKELTGNWNGTFRSIRLVFNTSGS